MSRQKKNNPATAGSETPAQQIPDSNEVDDPQAFHDIALQEGTMECGLYESGDFFQDTMLEQLDTWDYRVGLLFYPETKLVIFDYMALFYKYLQSADIARTLIILSEMYAAHLENKKSWPLSQGPDDFALLRQLFTDMYNTKIKETESD